MTMGSDHQFVYSLRKAPEDRTIQISILVVCWTALLISNGSGAAVSPSTTSPTSTIQASTTPATIQTSPPTVPQQIAFQNPEEEETFVDINLPQIQPVIEEDSQPDGSAHRGYYYQPTYGGPWNRPWGGGFNRPWYGGGGFNRPWLGHHYQPFYGGHYGG